MYYHGGVPALHVGAWIVPAAEMGLDFEYSGWAGGVTMPRQYNPQMVYLTGHLGTAMGYAARYVDHRYRRRPGDVYLVEPIDVPVRDPDYASVASSRISEMCSRARVVEVIERRVRLTLREQNRLTWPYSGWGSPTKPMYSEDGTLIASDQMRAEGVQDEYLALLPKWIDVSEVDARGRITRDGKPVVLSEMLDTFEHLELVRANHKITAGRQRGESPRFRCSCGATFADKRVAGLHKVDEEKVGLIARHNVPHEMPVDPVELVLVAIARRSAGRWSWYLRE